MRPKVWPLAGVVLALLVLDAGRLALAQGCCGRVSLPGAAFGPDAAAAKGLYLSLDYEYSRLDEMHEGFHSAPNPKEKETLTQTTSLTLSYSLTPKLSVTAVLPYISKTHWMIMGSSRVKRSWQEIGDSILLLRYNVYTPEIALEPIVSLSAGLRCPTGEDDVSDSYGRLSDTLQPGSGTWQPLLGAHVLVRRHPYVFFGSAVAKLPVDENDYGYRFGKELQCSVEAIRPLGKGFQLSGKVLGIFCGPDERDGQKVVNTGGTWIYLAPGLRYATSKGITLGACVELPIYQRVNANQLVGDWIGLCSVSYAF